jgi:hypothetical protein
LPHFPGAQARSQQSRNLSPKAFAAGNVEKKIPTVMKRDSGASIAAAYTACVRRFVVYLKSRRRPEDVTQGRGLRIGTPRRVEHH